MSEVLRLEFNASTEAFVITLDAVDANGAPVLGPPLPSKRVPLAELPPSLATAARSLLAGLHDHVRAATAMPLTAAEVATKEAALAAREEGIARREKALAAKEASAP